MDHKEKCRIMKDMRKKIADKIGVDLHQRECTYEGECSGTCPKCQSEEKKLNKALLSGGIAAASLMLAACGTTEGASNVMSHQDRVDAAAKHLRKLERAAEACEEELAGDVEVYVTEGDVPYNPEDDYDGGLEYYDPDEYQLEGEIAFEALTDDEIIEACIKYSDCDKAEMSDEEDDYYKFVYCYKDDELVMVMKVDPYSSYAYAGETLDTIDEDESIDLWAYYY